MIAGPAVRGSPGWTLRRCLPAALAVTVLTTAFIASRASCSNKASAGPSSGKVVIIIVAGVTPEEMPSKYTPFLSSLAAKWSVGLMSCRTGDKEQDVVPGGPTTEYLALGWGIRAGGAAGADLCFNSSEALGAGPTAGDLFVSYNNIKAPPEGVVALGWRQVRLANDDSTGNEFAGMLSTMLARHGRKVAVVGNQDTSSQPSRPAALICCDSQGRVPLGDVSSDLEKGTSRAAGMELASESHIEAAAIRFIERADFLVVDVGDTGRTDSATPVTSEGTISAYRRAALTRADRIAATIASRLDLSSSVLLVLSPTAPSPEREQGNTFAPIIAAGKTFSSGRVTSGSTRRAGLVSNLDVMPTVLEFFGIKSPAGAGGMRIETTGSGSFATLKGDYKQIEWTTRARWPVMIIYLVLYMLTLFGGILVVLRTTRSVSWPENQAHLVAPLRFLAMGLVAAALSVIVISAVSYSGYIFPVVFCALFSIALAALAWWLERTRPLFDAITSLCLLFVAVMIIDLFTGARLQLLPLVGSTEMEGLRFFGIGNVVAALTIACAAWGSAGILRGSRMRHGGLLPKGARRGVIAFLVFVALVLSLGALGANTGGLIVASATFGVFLFAISKRGLTRLRALLIAVGTCVAVGIVTGLDALVFNTHAGKAVKGGFSEIFPIIAQKLKNHFNEIKFALIPAIVMMIVVVVLILLVRRKEGLMPRAWAAEPERMSALYACLTGGFVALFFEDTGVTMMGAMVVITTCAAAYYSLARLPEIEDASMHRRKAERPVAGTP